MITFKQKGNFGKLDRYMKSLLEISDRGDLSRFGEMGVEALKKATPVDTGKTAGSWGYEIIRENNNVSIHWTNSNTNKGFNIALLIQYGHGTGYGYYVQGVDYINPALKPVFDAIAQSVWKEVTRL